jgi:hypothetical protein
MTLDSVRVALRGIFANRMRSALTMLGRRAPGGSG